MPPSLDAVEQSLPRERAKALPRALRSADVSREELERLLVRARRSLAAAASSDPDTWFEHLLLGVMRRNAVIRVIHIHHRHHLAIIVDIRAG